LMVGEEKNGGRLYRLGGTLLWDHLLQGIVVGAAIPGRQGARRTAEDPAVFGPVIVRLTKVCPGPGQGVRTAGWRLGPEP